MQTEKVLRETAGIGDEAVLEAFHLAHFARLLLRLVVVVNATQTTL